MWLWPTSRSEAFPTCNWQNSPQRYKNNRKANRNTVVEFPAVPTDHKTQHPHQMGIWWSRRICTSRMHFWLTRSNVAKSPTKRAISLNGTIRHTVSLFCLFSYHSSAQSVDFLPLIAHIERVYFTSRSILTTRQVVNWTYKTLPVP